MPKRLLAALFGLVLLLTLPAPGGAQTRAGGFIPLHHGIVPACDNAWALAKIGFRFAYKERRYWGSGAAIGKIESVKEIAHRPWGPDFIPRRHCAARVRMDDGKETFIAYAIGEKLGFAGMGFGVEWCVVGYDRSLAYGPSCRAALP